MGEHRLGNVSVKEELEGADQKLLGSSPCTFVCF